MRRAARTDANLTLIVDAFRSMGCSVNVRNDDMADLDVGYRGISMIVEVKDGKKPPSKRKLTTNQLKKRETWTGGIRLVQDLDDVQTVVQLLRNWHSAISYNISATISGYYA